MKYCQFLWSALWTVWYFYYKISSVQGNGVTDSGLMLEKCDRIEHKMIFRGTKLTLSKLIDEEGRLWCKHAQKLEIFALESISIDRDLKTPENQSLTVVLIANEWILNGHRIFDLSGRKGAPLQKAIEGHSGSPHGRNGVPGNPGQNGGSFYGRYEKLTTLEPNSSLVINVSGGNGGDGQEGGNGLDGTRGRDAEKTDFPSPYSELDSKMKRLRNLEFNAAFTYRYKNYIYSGKKGGPGGDGGDGGVGGMGGNPGYAVISVHENSRELIKILKENGKRGNNGKGGAPGHVGRAGDDMQCTWRGVLADSIRWWDKCHHVAASSDMGTGTRGKDGGNSVGLRQPSRVDLPMEEFGKAEQIFEKFVMTNTQ